MVSSYLLTVHHDGCFMYQPLRYENGSKIDINISRVCYEEMISFLEKDTSTVISSLYWCLPESEFEKGLIKIDNDNDLETMFDIGDSYGHINIYIDHFGDDISHYIDNNENTREDDGEVNAQLEKGIDEIDAGQLLSNVEFQVEDEVNVEQGVGEMDVALEQESEDEIDEMEGNEDESDANSLDHLSEGEEELAQVRIDKANKIPPPTKEPKQSVVKTDGDDEDFLMDEHEEFMTDLLKTLKSDEDGANENQACDDEHDRYPIHDPSTHWKLKKPMVGERFESPKQFKECVTHYALANGYSIWYKVSSNKKIIARCGTRPTIISDTTKGKQRKAQRYPKTENTNNKPYDCPWRCYARWMRKESSFQVISMNDVHYCSRSFKYGTLINYKWIGKEFGYKIRMNPDIKLVELANLVLKKFKCQVTLNQCRRAKKWASHVYEKSLVEHYGMLRAYGDELLTSNPGSTVKLGVTTNPDDKVYFDRFYVCLHALKVGWKKGCRRIIAIDGCFLKGACQGELLTTIGRDGNNHIFPIAWAVVNVENKDNWIWFISLLGEDLEIQEGQGLTLMSDQHKGLLEAVKEVMPYAEHRQCARHIYENFRKLFSGVEFRNMFWKAAKASYPLEYERIMNEIKDANPNAYEYLINKEPKTWSRAFFQLNSFCEAVENGFSECFNAVLVKVRSKPIITMLEAIRVILMERMEKMRKASDAWNYDICPSIIKKLEWAKGSSRFWNVMPGGVRIFEVRQGHDAFIVDEGCKTCTCRMWQLSGIPCSHAVAAIFFLHKMPEDYVPNWYRKEMYKITYGSYLKPVQGMNQWKPNEDLNKPLPPKPRNMPGRPRKKRKRAIHEPAPHVARVSKVGAIMTCRKCGGQGHNQRGCKATGEPAIGKGKGKLDDSMKKLDKSTTQKAPSRKSRKPTIDKGKGKLDDSMKKIDKSTTQKAPTVGGFMTDARKNYNISTQESTQSKEKGSKKKQKLMPVRRQAALRVTAVNMKKKISGSGSTSRNPMDLD